MKVIKKMLSVTLLMAVMVLLLVFVAACGGGEQSLSTNEPTGTDKDNTNNSSDKETEKSKESKELSFEVTLSNFIPDGHVMNAEIMLPFAKQLEEQTDGRVGVTAYTGGALGKPPEHYDIAVTGIADISFVIHGYTPGKFPVTQVAELPYIVPYEDVNAEILSAVLWDLYEKFPQIGEEHAGTKPLALWNVDPAVFMIRDKQINSIEEFKGLKIRSPSAAANAVIKELGAIPVNMPMPAVYDAMQKGVVDAVLGPISAFKEFKLYEVTSQVVDAKVYGTTFLLTMNEGTYNKFAGENLEILNSLTGREMSLKAGRKYDESAIEAWEMAEKEGIPVKKLTPEEVEKWEEVTKAVIEKWIQDMEDKGINGQEIYDEAVKLGKKYAKDLK
jgi:TRAP-type C4-dicarboxylate transport system substrate-binding protein